MKKRTTQQRKLQKWQREWENSTSKLRNIKPQIEEWECVHNSCRQYEIKLSRLRIGHTRLTQGYLMSRNEQQPKWKEERRKHGIEGDTNKKNTAKRVQSSKS